MRNSLVLLLILMVVSCKTDQPKENNEAVSNDELIMYEASEMTLLMEKMFSENERLKAKIEAGEELGEFNKEYLKIHTAVLTKPTDRNGTFEAFSVALLNNQKAVFKVEKTEAKAQFNKMVQTCIACHKTNCTGVIPRIEKLTIQ